MGRPKALLRPPSASETFVARVVRTLREGGLADVVVVCRPDDHELREHLAQLRPEPAAVVNPQPERGQLSSLLAGIAYAEAQGADAVVVLPVDIPQVQPRSVAAVLRALRTGSTPIVRATHGGRHGHPVAFRATIFSELRDADPGLGARAVLRSSPGRVENVEVDDPGVLRDVDLPEDYERLYGAPPA